MNRGTKATPSPADSKFLTAGSSAIESLFQWDSWEVRLLHPETKQLELFVSHNLAPLRIGESIFAAARGNGITGRVAATGQCVLTRQADTDEGISLVSKAAQSTMTLPLQLGTRILGTLNVESQERSAFSEADLSEALLLGRYIALRSLHRTGAPRAFGGRSSNGQCLPWRLGPPDGEIRVAWGDPPRSQSHCDRDP